MGELTVRAIRFEQNGRVFYTAAIPAGELIARTQVDVWSADVPEAERGYQRALQMTRVRKVADYVADQDAVMPIGGLLNARSPEEGAYGTRLRFTPDEGQDDGIQSGSLVVPGDAEPLWTVDMQHRLAGFANAVDRLERDDLARFPLVVTIADGLSKIEEIEQFELINTTQKKVATDLARQLLARQFKLGGIDALPDASKAWEARGAIVANWLDANSQVLAGRIIPPNKTMSQTVGGITKETTFVSSLKPVLTSPYVQRISDEEQIARIVDEYWLAMQRIWPQAIEFPKESVILKGPGVYPLHMLMPEVIETVRDQQQPLTADNMFAALADWRDLGSDYWDRDNTETGATRFGSSGQGHSRVAAELRARLPQPEFEMFE